MTLIADSKMQSYARSMADAHGEIEQDADAGTDPLRDWSLEELEAAITSRFRAACEAADPAAWVMGSGTVSISAGFRDVRAADPRRWSCYVISSSADRHEFKAESLAGLRDAVVAYLRGRREQVEGGGRA
jgi:hypothetical protein